MSPRSSHAQFFVTYFAQGVQRVGKDYIRHQAAAALHEDASALQLFYNLLPEFGSLPWTLKPLLMFLAERLLRPTGKVALAGLCGLLTGMIWLRLALSSPEGSDFLLCTALVSLGSAIVDGLVDGAVAEESVDSETAASCRYVCETGQFLGSLVVGLTAWILALGHMPLLLLLAGAWCLVAPFTALVGVRRPVGSVGADPASPHAGIVEGSKPELPGFRTLVGVLANGGTAAVAALGFTVCLSPTLDLFLFRQQSLGLTPSQQSLVSLAGSFGWFLGTTAYRRRLAMGRPAHLALRTCLWLWPSGSILSVAVALLAVPSSAATLPLATAEKAAAEFCKALTFMPVTVLMQLHAAKGCESTAFTLMQWSGTVGQVLSRNMEYAIMGAVGVSPKLGFTDFWKAAGVVAAWRTATAVVLLVAVPFVPQLVVAAEATTDNDKAEDRKQI